MSDALVLGSLLVWGACISLDDRSLFASILGSPIVAGLGAGLLVHDVTAGVAVGLLFQALYPVRVESGGQVPPAAGLASLSAVAFLWAAGVGMDPLFGGSGMERGVLAGGSTGTGSALAAESRRLAEAAAAPSALPLLALLVGIGVAETARRLERLLRARNAQREESAVPGLESAAAATGTGSGSHEGVRPSNSAVHRNPPAEPMPEIRTEDFLPAIRRAQIGAIVESSARGAGVVLFAAALGWPLRDVPSWIESMKPGTQIWRGALWVAPLLGAAFLLRDLPLGGSGPTPPISLAPPTRFRDAARIWFHERRLWVVTLLGVGAGVLATGWLE